MSRQPSRVAALGGIVGPVAFVAAWSILGSRTAGYSATGDAISRLAATGAPTQAAMTAGFIAYGAGLPLFGAALRGRLRGSAWVFATATGVATLGVAAAPLGSPTRDTVHGVFAALGYATLAGIPLTAAKPLADEGRWGWAGLSVITGVASAACLLATTLGPRDGLFQRAGLTITDAWVIALAVDMLRKNRP